MCSGKLIFFIVIFFSNKELKAQCPVVTISANYCYGGGKIQLTANSSLPSTFRWNTDSTTTYHWNTDSTTQSILVDVAGTFKVTATAISGGCQVTTSISVAQELINNGNFSGGNVGFTSTYAFNNDLYPESRYIINNNPSVNHSYFFGRDHTTNNGKFMIVNGAGLDSTVVWEETVPVIKNSTYYFSAWAISLNDVSPFAQLQFSINGVLFGTSPVLPTGPTNNSPPYNWVRFYGSWNSGNNTSAIISIVDLQTAAGGNDFGLDDISFGPLSSTITAGTVITHVKCNGASTGSVVITPSGGVGPYTITPVQTGLAAGTYNFTITDANSCTLAVPVTITQPTAITASTVITNVKCNGASTGSVVITPTGGVGPYTITPVQTGLAAGTYNFTITDANNCTLVVPVTITQPTAITASTVITHVNCNGASTGSVVITPAGGVGPYTITPVQTGLAAGTYNFTVNRCK